MSRIYNTDVAADMEALRKMKPGGVVFPEVYPRQNYYGEPDAVAAGLEPVEAVPDVLLQPDQYEDALKEAHELQTLPIYHAQHTWRPVGYRYSQNGLNYCWGWSLAGAGMTCRAMEDKETVKLAPVSMGYLVGWKNRGNHLQSGIKGFREDGICPAPDGNMNSTNRSASYWAQYAEQRKLYRLDKVWDTNARAGDAVMKQHCLSILVYGRSGYAAWNHLMHAMEVLSIRIENGVWYWDISNSHNSPEILTMTGSLAVPDEFYGFISTVAA